MKKIELIAEIGVNHNGNLSLAKKLIKKASLAGADYAKFQIFEANKLAIKKSKKAKYQNENLKKNISQYEMLKNYEISKLDVKKLNDYCKKHRIKFLASCFDIDSLKLYSSFNNDSVKIPSGEITNLHLIEYAAKKFKKLIISTGMSNYLEITQAIKTVIKQGVPKKNITLLQCTTDYPALAEEANLNCMEEFKKKFGTEIGYSDHTEGTICSIVAASRGATIIEKHFTLNKKLKGPDHKASMNFKELIDFNNKIKAVKIILGSKTKKITHSEIKNIHYVRKSIYAKKKISKGEVFTISNIIAKRPLGGIPASNLKKVLGKKSKKNFQIDEKIQL
jgi:N,N'-diacetyllegionaminate synthase